MSFIVHELPRARVDKRQIFGWLLERSPMGAAAWLDSYDLAVERLTSTANAYPSALEARDLEVEVKQILFKTRRGRMYRIVYLIDQVDVYILRVRGPGQAPITPDDLGPSP